MAQKITVNGEEITDERIREAVSKLREELEARHGPLPLEQRMELRKYALNELIGETLLAQEASNLGLEPDKLFEHWAKGVKEPTPGEIRDYYRKNREMFKRRDMIHAAHIVKNFDAAKEPTPEARELMESLYQRLQNGEDFAALATEYSDCPENGGDLGFFPKGVMVDEFDARVWDAPLNTPTAVFETPFGLHIAVVYDRRAAGIASLEEVSEHIAAGLRRVLHDNEYQQRLTDLRQKAVIR